MTRIYKVHQKYQHVNERLPLSNKLQHLHATIVRRDTFYNISVA